MTDALETGRAQDAYLERTGEFVGAVARHPSTKHRRPPKEFGPLAGEP
jgi:hypothetical protein